MKNHTPRHFSTERSSSEVEGLSEASASYQSFKLSDLNNVWHKAQSELASGLSNPLSVDELGPWIARFSANEIDELVIPKRTLVRRRANHEDLSREEQDKAFRLARITSEADRVFGDKKIADRWLRQPLASFAGQKPLQLLKTEHGALAIDEVLGQIDHGIFN